MEKQGVVFSNVLTMSTTVEALIQLFLQRISLLFPEEQKEWLVQVYEVNIALEIESSNKHL
jgi:hypothetical protein